MVSSSSVTGGLSNSTLPASITNWLESHEAVFIIGLLIAVFVIGYLIILLFHTADEVRHSVVFSHAVAVILALLFMAIVYKFAGTKTTFAGINLDLGMFLYIIFGVFIIFIIGS